MVQNRKTVDRDHAGGSFSMWYGCALLKQGPIHGQSDEGVFKSIPPKAQSWWFGPLGQIVNDSRRFPHMIVLVKREKCRARQVYQPPGGESIGARASAMRSAFVRSLIPNVPPSDLELADAFSILKLDADDLRCVYCGDTSTEWDHFYPAMRDGQPTGYLTRIQNLVPACGKCNQSKGNRDWRDWMTSTAPLSPTTRGVKKLGQRIKRLQSFEAWGAEAIVDFEAALGSDAMRQHNDYLKQILSLMNEAETHSKALRSALLDGLPHVIQEKKPSLWRWLLRLVFGGR